MKVKSLLLWTIAMAFIVLITSCTTATVSYPTLNKKKTNGPPAHAPAHGYRRKLPSSVEIVFDSDSGVYVVVGWEKHFWVDGQYYRFYNGQWEISTNIESGWKIIGEEKLPLGLQKKYTIKHKSKNQLGRSLALDKR